MAISGLVITLSDDAAATAALSMFSNDSRFTLGERFGRRVALVAETPSVELDRAMWDELRGNPGIVNVDVTFVHLDPNVAALGDPIKNLKEDQNAHH